MRILQVHNCYQQAGGEDTVVDVESEILRRRGHEVQQFKVLNDDIEGFTSKLRVALTVDYSRSSRNLLEKKLKKTHPNIVHVHNFFPLITPSIYDACRDAGIPVVQTLHNYRTICPGALLMRDGNICERCVTGSAYQAVLYGCYRDSRLASLSVARMVEYHRKKNTWTTKVDRFIALTEFAREKFITAGFPSEKIVVKPNFVTNNYEVLKTEFPDTEKSYALFVGRLSSEKGVGTLLRAWKSLSIPVHLVGEGPLVEKIQSAGLDMISSLGQMDSKDVWKKMSEADFLVMPSECYEGFPLVLAEAFSCGLPVVASRLGGMAEIIEDGVTGLHFEAGNPEDLAEKVSWMHNNPEKCKKMGENARRVYLEKYTSEINYEMLMMIYQGVIDDYE